MSVNLKSITSNIVSEYAATAITFNRYMRFNQEQNIYQPSFSGSINYNRADYVLDEDGNKVALVSRPDTNPMGNSEWYGVLMVPEEKMAEYLSIISEKTVFEFLADMADALIKEDLVKRNILAE